MNEQQKDKPLTVEDHIHHGWGSGTWWIVAIVVNIIIAIIIV